MSVLWARRKHFILLMQENFALDFNAVLILICLCDNKSVPVMEQVCQTVQPQGRCWAGASWTGKSSGCIHGSEHCFHGISVNLHWPWHIAVVKLSCCYTRVLIHLVKWFSIT